MAIPCAAVPGRGSPQTLRKFSTHPNTQVGAVRSGGYESTSVVMLPLSCSRESSAPIGLGEYRGYPLPLGRPEREAAVGEDSALEGLVKMSSVSRSDHRLRAE